MKTLCQPAESGPAESLNEISHAIGHVRRMSREPAEDTKIDTGAQRFATLHLTFSLPAAMAPVADPNNAQSQSQPKPQLAKGAKHSTKEIIDLEHNYSA